MHGQCREDMNNGSGFFSGREAQRGSTSRLLRQARANRDHHPRPSPHAATEEKQEPRASFKRQRIAECSIAEGFVLRHDARQPCPDVSTIGAQRTFFFMSTARSIVLGWTSKLNFFRIRSAS